MIDSKRGPVGDSDSGMGSAADYRSLGDATAEANVAPIESAPSYDAHNEAWMIELSNLEAEIAAKQAKFEALMSEYQMVAGDDGVLKSASGGRADPQGVRLASDVDFELGKLKREYRENPRRQEYERRRQAEGGQDEAA